MSQEPAHLEVEHDYGPSYCSICRTKWPCESDDRAAS